MWNYSDIAQNLPIYLMRIPVVLLSLTVHETAHGWVAYKLGDPTAHDQGRLTLNPLKHLDIIGTIMMLLFGFGWAKPVPINSRYFKNPKRDTALTALAGPVSNLLLGLLGVLLYSVFVTIFGSMSVSANVSNLLYVVALFLTVFYSINVSFAVFNLIPVPPLDGSRVLLVFLPTCWYFKVMQYERYIALAMMVLLFTGIIDAPLSAAVNWVVNGMFWLVGLLPFIR